VRGSMSNIKNLIKSILYLVIRRRSGCVTKTKLLKYLYLIDIEYYRLYGKTFTGFNWIFYKYGPWTNEFEHIYDAMVKTDEIKVSILGDAELLSTDEDIELQDVLNDTDIRIRVDQILTEWADEQLGKMLNYVYFHTEPMEGAEKGKYLDFSKVEKVPEKFVLSHSRIDPKRLQEMRQKLKEKWQKREEQKKLETEFTPPNYDDVYWEAVRRMNEDNGY
jgi:hypothetical protein